MNARVLMIAAALAACEGAPDAALQADVAAASDAPVTVRFAAQVGEAALVCGQTYPAEGPFAAPFEITDLRLYVHDVQLERPDGELVPLALVPDDRWQSASEALLDFEDGTGGCVNGSAETRVVLEGLAPAGTYVGVQLTLGVSFERNHGDPIQAGAPLTLTSMHWGWLGGHKFLRLAATDGATSAQLHLGSTGCEGTIGAITACANENRPTLRATGLDPTRDVIVIDVAPLLAGLPAGEDASCMGDPSMPACAAMLGALDLTTSGVVRGGAR